MGARASIMTPSPSREEQYGSASSAAALTATYVAQAAITCIAPSLRPSRASPRSTAPIRTGANAAASASPGCA